MEDGKVTQDLYEESVLEHPWIRYFARGLDLSLYSILWMLVQRILLRWHIGESMMQGLVEGFFSLILMLLLEPLFLHLWGTTPAKRIFGLSLHSQEGNKLSYREAFYRTLHVLKAGMGFSIPIYNLVRFYKSYAQCKRGETMDWDEGLQYRIRDTKGWRIALYIAVKVLLLGIGVLIILEAQLPPHRGDITPVQYAQNVNDTRARFGYRDALLINEAGEWTEKEQTGGTYYFRLTNPLRQELIVEDGVIMGVRLHASGVGEWFDGYSEDKRLVAVSFLLAQPGMSGLRFSTDPVFKQLDDELNSYSFETANVRVTNTVEHKGYLQSDSGYLYKENPEGESSYNMTFEMIRMDAKAANP